MEFPVTHSVTRKDVWKGSKELGKQTNKKQILVCQQGPLRPTMSLFDIRNSVLLGNYQSAINLAESFRAESESEKLERDIFLYRAHAQQGDHQIVLNEIKDSDPLPLQAVKTLAVYLAKKDKTVLNTLKAWEDNGFLSDPTAQIIAGIIYFKEGLFEACFAALHPQRSLEAYDFFWSNV